MRVRCHPSGRLLNKLYGNVWKLPGWGRDPYSHWLWTRAEGKSPNTGLEIGVPNQSSTDEPQQATAGRLSFDPQGADRRILRMPTYTRIDRFTVPLGGQEIVLEDVRDDAGGMPLLRIRIRERSRFTIFDVDATTAARWGRSMVDWSGDQALAPGDPRP